MPNRLIKHASIGEPFISKLIFISDTPKFIEGWFSGFITVLWDCGIIGIRPWFPVRFQGKPSNIAMDGTNHVFPNCLRDLYTRFAGSGNGADTSTTKDRYIVGRAVSNVFESVCYFLSGGVPRSIHVQDCSLSVLESVQLLSGSFSSTFGGISGIPVFAIHKIGQNGIDNQTDQSEHFDDKSSYIKTITTFLAGVFFLGWGWWRVRFRWYGVQSFVLGLCSLLIGVILIAYGSFNFLK
jgi:hypothetical protein